MNKTYMFSSKGFKVQIGKTCASHLGLRGEVSQIRNTQITCTESAFLFNKNQIDIVFIS